VFAASPYREQDPHAAEAGADEAAHAQRQQPAAGNPPTLCITIDEPMISAAVTMPITSRFAARFTCSPKPCSAVVSTFSCRRPRRAA
jgi:hypothetical protein